MRALMSLADGELARLCREYGQGLMQLPPGVDAAALLWAIAGKESSFGARCIPLHENSYCYGSNAYRADKLLRDLTEAYGCAAHCSYGPWQIMLYNACMIDKRMDPVILLTDPGSCAGVTVGKLNLILARDKPLGVREVADAWNSGSARDANFPLEYMNDVERFYKQRLEEGIA